MNVSLMSVFSGNFLFETRLLTVYHWTSFGCIRNFINKQVYYKNFSLYSVSEKHT